MLELVSGGVFGLVQTKFNAAGEFEGGDQSPTGVLYGTYEFDTFGLQLFNGRLDVVAHEVQW